MNSINSVLVNTEANDIDAGPAVLPLTPLQRGYFVGRRPDFDLHVHPHLYMEFDFEECDISKLERAVTILINRHPMMRSVILASAEIAFNGDLVDYKITQYDLTTFGDLELDLRLKELRAELSRFNFDCSKPGAIDLRVSHLPQGYRVHINIDLLLFDGSSVRNILRELSCLYNVNSNAANMGATITSNLHDLSQYADFCKVLKYDKHYNNCKNYWLERLQSFPNEPLLPVKLDKLTRLRSQFNRRKYLISKDKWAAFYRRCDEIDANPSTVLFALYSLVVSFWSKDQHFYMTMMLQGDARHKDEFGNIYANMASIILVEVDYRNTLTLGDSVYQIRNQVFRDITKSKYCGIELLQERNRNDLALTRIASPVAFVSMLVGNGEQIQDSIFQLENQNMVFNSLETPQVILDHQAISRPDGGVSLVWDSLDDDMFEDGVIHDMYTAYTALVEQVISDSGIWQRTTHDLRNPGQLTKHQAYNATVRTTKTHLLHQYLYDSAAIYPEKALLIDANAVISYDQARRLSNRLAWTLRESYHIKANDLVAVCLPKSWQQIIAIQGILAAGAAYVPVMPWLPEERKKFILSSCNCTVVITDNENTTEVFADLVTLSVDDQSLLAKETNLPAINTLEDTAYIIFTSGSTGVPKGVVLDHQGPSNTIEDINCRFGITHADVLFGISDISFDLSVYDIFGTIKAGASLVLPKDGEQRNPQQCLHLVRQHNVTVWNSVPALAQLFVDYLELTNTSESLGLRLVMMSGDWIPVDLPTKIHRQLGATTYSLGGATEASIWSITYPIRQVAKHWKSIPYGFPMKNQTIHILDKRLQPRPDNVVGEIYIGGIGLAKGYWDDEEKTKSAFVVHPKTGERIYRTGDWGVRRSEGFIEFLGREDSQVKIRGYRIELGEIEYVLQNHPLIERAISIVDGESNQDKSIITYIVPIQGSEQFDVDKIRTYLQQYLPEYMVPAHLIVLSEIPLSSTGKVDRKSLPRPDQRRDESTTELLVTQTEKKLAGCWQEILNIKKIYRHDNFFHLGGTSFSAVNLVVHITEKFKVDIQLSELIRSPTLYQLADFIDKTIATTSKENTKAQESIPTHNLVKLTDLQDTKQFWFHPSGGNVFCYQEIAKSLASTVSIYALQSGTSPSIEHHDQPTIRAMGEQYIEQIQTVQPEGPYHLAGWSLGGILAYEVAQQLLQSGNKVASLTIIDSPAPFSRELNSNHEVVKWFISDVSGVDELPDLGIHETADINNYLLASLKKANEIGLIDFFDADVLKGLFAVFQSNIHALYSYNATPLNEDVDCLLVMAIDNQQYRVPSKSLAAWKTLLPQSVKIHQINGNHYNLLSEPRLKEVQSHIQTLMNNVNTNYI